MNKFAAAPATLGILGGGQLARMLALAALPMGMRSVVLSPEATPCASACAGHIHAPYDDPGGIERLAQQADVVTFEFENVPAASVHRLAQWRPAHPPAKALDQAQDRLLEKRLFHSLEIPVLPFVPVQSFEELQAAVATVGVPAVLKTRREGYDGLGQFVLHSASDLPAALEAMCGKPALLEAFAPFEREVSIIAVRSRTGETRFYPISENVHESGVLRLSTAMPDDPMQGPAETYALRLLEALEYVGVMAVEFFQVGQTLYANEFAPRVHNSGHWTIEGAETSQFANHVRAVAGLPLGETTAVGRSAMVNFLGALPPAAEVLAIPGAHLHDYSKTPRPGRKVGHATVRVPTQGENQLRHSVSRMMELAREAALQRG